MDFDNRFTLGLSNEENQHLEENVENKTKKLFVIESEIEENRDRIRMLDEHRKIIEDELRMIQRLLFVRRPEPTCEVNRDELQRVERTIESIEEDRIRSEQREKLLRNEIDRFNEQITLINDQKSIDKEILDELTENLKKKDEETFALMKYTRQDDLRIKELTKQLEEKNICSHKLKRRVEEEKLEMESLRNQLDKMAESFRHSFCQREKIIERWEIMIEQIRCKDRQIERFTSKLVEIQNQSRTISNRLDEDKSFYLREEKTNKFLEKILRFAEKKIFQLKNDRKCLEEKNRHGESEIVSLRLKIRRTSDEIQRERATIDQLDSMINEKSNELKRLRQYRSERKRSIFNENVSLNENENVIEIEEKYQTNLRNQMSKFNEEYFRLKSEVNQLEQREKEIQIEHQMFVNQLRHRTNEIHRLDQKFYVQQEMFYQQDFRKQTLDQRLNRFENVKRDERSDELEEKIRLLKKDEIEGKSRRDQLENQLKNLRDEFRSIENQIECLTKIRNEFDEKFLRFDLFVVSNEKQVKKLQNEKENFLVEENFLQLELKNFKEILRNSTKENLTFEEEKCSMEKAMRQRRVEIEKNFQMFRLRLNDERKKRTNLRNEFGRNRIRIEKLKIRYECLTLNENDEEKSIRQQAKFVVQLAQIKEDLFTQGDRLEASIIKAEREIRALENTLRILTLKNVQMTTNSTTFEMEQMKQLEAHRRALNEQIRLRQETLNEIRRELKGKDRIAELEDQLAETSLSMAEKTRIQLKLEDEIEQINVKTNRAEQFIRRYSCPNHQLDDDVRQRVLSESNEKIEQLIISICSRNNDRSLIKTLEEISRDLGRPIVAHSSTNSHRQSGKTMSKTISTLIHIDIDTTSKNSRSSSESTRDVGRSSS